MFRGALRAAHRGGCWKAERQSTRALRGFANLGVSISMTFWAGKLQKRSLLLYLCINEGLSCQQYHILEVWTCTGLNSIHFYSSLIWIRSHKLGGASATGMIPDYFSCYLKNNHPKLNLDLSAPKFWFCLIPHKTLKPTCHLCQNLHLITEGDDASTTVLRLILL